MTAPRADICLHIPLLDHHHLPPSLSFLPFTIHLSYASSRPSVLSSFGDGDVPSPLPAPTSLAQAGRDSEEHRLYCARDDRAGLCDYEGAPFGLSTSMTAISLFFATAEPSATRADACAVREEDRPELSDRDR
jgi:hypothetical protein